MLPCLDFQWQMPIPATLFRPIKPESLVLVYMMIVLLLTLGWGMASKGGDLPQKMAYLYGTCFQLQVQLCKLDYDM